MLIYLPNTLQQTGTQDALTIENGTLSRMAANGRYQCAESPSRQTGYRLANVSPLKQHHPNTPMT